MANIFVVFFKTEAFCIYSMLELTYKFYKEFFFYQMDNGIQLSKIVSAINGHNFLFFKKIIGLFVLSTFIK
jgi:hypothetical protein